MRQCCICGIYWKESKNEKKFNSYTLIYGCANCHKGYWEKNLDNGYFMNGALKVRRKK